MGQTLSKERVKRGSDSDDGEEVERCHSFEEGEDYLIIGEPQQQPTLPEQDGDNANEEEERQLPIDIVITEGHRTVEAGRGSGLITINPTHLPTVKERESSPPKPTTTSTANEEAAATAAAPRSAATLGDVDIWLEHLYRCEPLSEADAAALCHMAKKVLLREPTVQHLQSPISICGDIHGQFHDLMELFRIGGRAPDTQYLFLGDFVDRGINSLETFQLMMALKVRYPDRVHLLRGNHESRQITQVYGFYEECRRKYGTVLVWRYCTEVFDCLSLAAVINNQMLCVHGGLSPKLKRLDDISAINRVQEIPHEGPMCDLLWSDPDELTPRFAVSARGAGHLFGAEAVEQFCHDNKLERIGRAHQLVMEGYKWHFDKRVVTVWSAPNYCYRCGNVASIMRLDEEMCPNFAVFSSPNILRAAPLKTVNNIYFL